MLNTYTQNLHTHGVLDDGKDTYESTVKRAIELGFDSIGFSGHSSTSYSKHSMSIEGTNEYKKEIARLKEQYADKIDVFCGIEFDMYSSDDLRGYDYVIGSLHYFHMKDEYVGFDRSADEVKRIIDTYFDGSGIQFAKMYYETISQLPQYGKCDIVGHLDLVAKQNETCHFFDITSKEYKKYVLDAIDVLTQKIGIFEINTGGVVRGYRKTFYPDAFILKSVKERNGNIVISSDCHDNRYLNYGFEDALNLARECGFKEVLKLTKVGFVPVPLY